MKKAILVLFLGAVLSSCATEPPRLYTSASGRPEATFEGQMPAAVIGKLAGLCMDRQGVVISQDANQMVCQKDLPPGSAILAQLLIGNQYSTTPILKVRFTAAQIGSYTRVQVYEWVETQMAFGQMRTVELNSNSEFNKLEGLLAQIGGHVESAPAPVP